MTRVARLAAVAMSLTVAACGVRVEGSPTEVADDEVPFGLLTSTTTSAPPRDPIVDTRPEITVCFHRGSTVVAVSRASSRRGVVAALEAFLDGPTSEESASGLSSAAFDPSLSEGVRTAGGVATVRLSPELADVGAAVQLDVIVKLVCTLTAQPGVGQVAFELGDERIEVPRGDGSRTAEPVTREDYPGLIG